VSTTGKKRKVNQQGEAEKNANDRRKNLIIRNVEKVKLTDWAKTHDRLLTITD